MIWVAAFALLAGTGFSAAGYAADVSISDTKVQSGYSDVTTDQPIPITANAFDYTTQNYQRLGAITNVSLTITIEDGDTVLEPPLGDYDQLTLALDGYDTGIKLNGFPDSETVTATVSGTPDKAAEILAALQADGQLVATIVDANPGDNGIGIPSDFSATLTLAVNEVPDAVDDSFSVPEGQMSTLDVLGNDTDAEGDTLSIVNFTQPTNGSVILDDNGTPDDTGDDTLNFTPTGSFFGSDSFTYTISDGIGGSDTATVTLNVTRTGVRFSVMSSYSGAANNRTATLVYKVENFSSARLTEVVVKGGLSSGGYSANDKAKFTASKGSVSAAWQTSKEIERKLYPSKNGRNVTWNIGAMNANEVATLTVVVPLNKGASGKALTDKWKVSFKTTGNGQIPPAIAPVIVP